MQNFSPTQIEQTRAVQQWYSQTTVASLAAATCERKTVGFATACELIWTVTEFGSGRCQSREFVARLNGIKLWFARLRNK
ncbi:hypothetical protein Csa_007565 [Cucumis sativus]|uniref:Uncharacterized protein n=1 Tax=Cucumis sativus TaxID=3659 RepID=A0A0A0LZD7_CUCSA|nr:hypothetical protein Csa_007565 [Cucumis sativus]